MSDADQPRLLEVETPQDLLKYVGQELGISQWILIDQDRIQQFADATNDHQWIHLDAERAAKELPTKSTIAHGFLTMSLIAGLPTFRIKHSSNMINYGINRLRFTNMVPVNSRVRLRTKLAAADEMRGNGVRLTCEQTIDIEGEPRPALVAQTLMVAYA
ncbi:MAG: MaoC family dehydratase [Alphaproteobacteria bacterium]|nr:MaoC family dehydratase [Alphaproteobacteria bacterium]MCB9929348.1 MaoC family dehydratase [Alphaproteobacteria bacterium]